MEPQKSGESPETLPGECDVVMKGGITSGVVYPRLVAELSKRYSLRSIGGTSAGAIAAAAAAAAQLGVTAGTNPDAFNTLERLPKFLGESAPGSSGSRLLHLFQPTPRLRRHFRVLSAALNAKTSFGRLARVLLSLSIHFFFGALLGAVPGLVLFVTSTGVGQWISVVLILLGAIVGAVVNGILSLLHRLPQAGFGLCDGMSAPDTEPQALTSWLHTYLNQLAGKDVAEPLTFGELWASQLRRKGNRSPYIPGGEKHIQLAMITTALNLRRPFLVPFESNDIYFCEQELRQYFPPAVANWMVDHARASETATRLSTPERRILALPRPEDLPVLFGVRLSLSFPVLLSAIPLYGVDRTLQANSGAATVATRVYFSDGGICSNFPIQFFDAPLPSRPTFGVDLVDFHPEHLDRRVWLPEVLRNNQGVQTYIPPLPDTPGLTSVVGFLSSIVETMQNWRDQMQLVMPGYRDRIVHVSHSSDEGGLNLNMDPDVITRLGEAGATAATTLIAAFGQPGSDGWANHRRIRLRTLVGAVQKQLDALAAAVSRQDQPTWSAVARDEHPPSYPFPTSAERQAAAQLLDLLEQASMALRTVDLDDESPRPRPEWRATPRI